MAKIDPEIYNKVKELPDTPGVYMFLDGGGKILYVGKAVALRKRVSSYFRPGRAHTSRLELLVGEVRDIRIIKTASEAEALIYEAGLIKDYRPKFNIELKDDKSYPFLKLTVNEAYPRFFLTRRKENDGALYFGPYVDVKLLKDALVFMKKVFPLRSCRKMRKKLCLEYHIGQCLGPCEAKVSRGDYKKAVARLISFLKGRKSDLLRGLKTDMNEFSKKKEYEKALAARNMIEALTAMKEMHDKSRRPIYGELDEIRNILGLAKEPVVIECFDISNTGGSEAVGSMVRFVRGMPDRSGYRKFRIKTVKGADDYSMIKEVVRRRYTRLLDEKKELPDLVLIDGGKGHLFSAKEVIDELGLNGKVAVASIAKEFNHLYSETKSQPMRLSPGSRVLLLIQRIRDEAHRFAITYHRKLRAKRSFE